MIHKVTKMKQKWIKNYLSKWFGPKGSQVDQKFSFIIQHAKISPSNTFQWIKMPVSLIEINLVRTNYDCWLDHVIVFVTWWKSISVIWLHVCLSCSVRFFILDLKNFLSTAAAHFRLYTAPQAVIIKILKQIIIKKLKKGQIQIQVVFVGWNPTYGAFSIFRWPKLRISDLDFRSKMVLFRV